MKALNATKFLVICFATFSVLFLLFAQKVSASHSRVDLLTADDFAVLAGSAVTDTGTTAIEGDVGLSPTGGTAITGLTCAEMTGTIYDTNGGYTGGGGGSTACLETNAGVLTTAKNDLTTAYNDAAGRTTTLQVPTELGGTTLTDGTYDSADGTFGVTGALTLDGEGNPDAVFIFKMASTLITASSSEVVLINGAQACNVYWQVGSSATLGTSTTLVGNVLAEVSITDDGGSTVDGRLLASSGAVTLNNSTVTKQDCAAVSSPATATASIESLSSDSSSGSVGGASVCVANLITAVPVLIESSRTSPTSVFINWGPYAGIETFIVRYGLVNGEWLYSTNVSGFSTTLNDLPPDQPIWIQIAARDDCSIGTYGEPQFVGGPRLPNAGFAPGRIFLRHLQTTFFVVFLFFQKLHSV